MGNSPDSKLHEALNEGNEKKAQSYWEELQRKGSKSRPFDVNYVYHQNEANNTVILSAAVSGCEELYRDLLDTKNLDPKKTNFSNRNVLHLICIHSGPTTSSKRLRMLEMTVDNVNCSTIITLLNDKDKLILKYGVDVFDKNDAGLTACDLAMGKERQDVANLLESRMVFSQPIGQAEQEEVIPKSLLNPSEEPRGITLQDVRCAKDVVLIQTADLLGVPLFSAEALLKSQEWSRDRLLEAWFDDVVETCEKAGIPIPDLSSHPLEVGLSLNPKPLAVLPSQGEQDCEICFCGTFDRIQLICDHVCCKGCWERYLTDKVESNDIQDIYCPGYGCFTRVPVDIIEKVIPRETARKFLQYDIRAFIESNPNMCWCPQPGCDKAVALFGENNQVLLASEVREKSPIIVHCGEGHFFCWKCSGEPHEPCTCEQWEEWKSEVEQMKEHLGQNLSTGVLGKMDTMNDLWLAEYSKKCPKCKAHIEKTVGCNHMTCRKCKHDFCWVCLDHWNLHNSATGGYFECTRREEIDKVEKEKEETLKSAKERAAVNNFKDMFGVYQTHCEKLKVELHYLENSSSKMEHLKVHIEGQLPHVGATASSVDVAFLKDSLLELVKTRLVLKASCVYRHKIEFNRSQERESVTKSLEALTDLTDKLANMVAKTHLRHRQYEIMQMTSTVERKRAEFLEKLPEFRQLPKDPSPRSSTIEGLDHGPLMMIEHLLRMMGHPDPDDERLQRRRMLLRHLVTRRSRDRGFHRRRRPGGFGTDTDTDTDTDQDDDDDDDLYPSIHAVGDSSRTEQRSSVAPRQRVSTMPRPRPAMTRPSLRNRPGTPPYHDLVPVSLNYVTTPSAPSPSRVDRPPNDVIGPRPDTPVCDHSVFQDSTPHTDNRYSNTVSTSSPSLFLPPLPQLLRPPEAPFSPFPEQNNLDQSTTSSTVSNRRQSSSTSHDSSLHGLNDYDEDEAVMTAVRESLRDFEQGGTNEDLEYERQLQLALALSLQDAEESNVPTFRSNEHAESTNA